MKMWRVRDWGSIKIESFEVVKQTPKSITYRCPSASIEGRFLEQKEMKVTQYHSWHATFEDARAHVVQQKERTAASLRATLQKVNSELGQFKKMKEPA